MAVSSIDAGKTLCELSKWKTSNLRLQKLLYIAHMYYVGTENKDLIKEDFYAWRFGPVEPELYHYCKVYGADCIQNIFPKNGGVEEGDDEYDILERVVEMSERVREASLVSFTHWEKGAWFDIYKRKKRYGSLIPRDSIKKEHEHRVERHRKKKKNNG